MALVLAAVGLGASPSDAHPRSAAPEGGAAPSAVRQRGAAATPTAGTTASAIGTTTTIATGTADLRGIVTGPDGNIWFTSEASDRIGRSTPAGAVTLFPSVLHRPWGITVGPDGALWFTSLTESSVGRLAADGTVTTFPVGTALPRQIVAGPDGNLWFTLGNPGLGRLTPAGVFTTFLNVTPGGFVWSLAAGPGGTLWYAGGGAIGTLAPDGTPTPLASLGSLMVALAAGPDGNMWFAAGSGSVGRVTPTGTVTSWTAGGLPLSIARGADGAMWFLAPRDAKALGRITMAGTITRYVAGFEWMNDESGSLTAGPDGNVWMASQRGVSRVATNGSVDHFPAPALSGNNLARAANGDLWTSDYARGAITRVTPTGELTTFQDPRILGVQGMAADPSGAFWFTVGDAIGNITPAGVITIVTDPVIRGPGRIRSAPNGDMWFTIEGDQHLVRRAADGTLTKFVVPWTYGATVFAVDAQGNAWFETKYGQLGRAAAGGAVTVFPISQHFIGVYDMTLGPDGNIWAIARGAYDGGIDGLIKVAANGQVTLVAVPGTENLGELLAGPDGNLWVGTRTGFVRYSPSTGASRTFAVADVVGPHGLVAGPQDIFFLDASQPEVRGTLVRSVRVLDDPSNQGLRFHPVAPKRLLDSRTSTGGWAGPLVAGAPQQLTVAGGTTGIPPGAGAVVVNVTATGATANTFLTVYPTGGAPPATSNLNVAAGETIPTLATVRVGTGGSVSFQNAAGSVGVVADVVGWFDAQPGDRFAAVDPVRFLDSRTSTGGWGAPLAAGAPRSLAVRGVGVVPATAEAVVMNVTATAATDGSFLTVYPSGGGGVPTASNLNFGAGQTIPNLVTVRLGADGAVLFANAVGSVDVVADVVGYFDPVQGDVFRPVDPVRLLDSRTATGGWSQPLAAGNPQSLAVIDEGALPGDVTSVIGTTTVTGGSDASFLTVFPTGGAPPGTSNLNFAAGQTIPNLVAVKLGTGGSISFANAVGTTDVVFDLAGYFAPD